MDGALPSRASNFLNMLSLKRIIEESRIYEGLILTHSIDKSIEIMERWFSSKNKNYSFSKSTGGLIIFETDFIDEIDFEKLLKLMNNLGWYPSFFRVGKIGPFSKYDKKKYLTAIGNRQPVELNFEAKYNLELDETDLSDKMYHLTPKGLAEKIIDIGLSPKSKNKLAKHSERIYLLKDITGVDFLLNNNKFYPDERNFILFSVDMKSLLERKPIRIFQDSIFRDYGVYTYENIPPQYLSIEKEIPRLNF